MNLEIDYIFEKAGHMDKYHFIVLLLFFILYGSSQYLLIIIPFLELRPLVDYVDENHIRHSKILNHGICEKYNFTLAENYKKSLITDLGIYCDKNLTLSLIASLFLGSLLGSIFAYKFADKFGRIKTLFSFTIFMIVLKVSFFFIYEYQLTLVWLFFSGVSCSIILITMVVYIIEITDKGHLAIYMSIIFSSFSFYGIFLSLFFHYLNYWRLVFFIVGVIDLIVIFPIYNYIVESPYFFYAQGSYENFYTSSKRIALKNGREKEFDEYFYIKSDAEVTDNSEQSGSDVKEFYVKKSDRNLKDNKNQSYDQGSLLKNSSMGLNSISFNEKLNQSISGSNLNCNYKIPNYENDFSMISSTKPGSKFSPKHKLKKNNYYSCESGDSKSNSKKLMFENLKLKSISDYNLLDLVKYEQYRKYFLVLSYIWITTAIIVNAVSFNLKNLSQGNIYDNSLIIFLIDIVCSIFVGFISNTHVFGRKKTLILLLIISFCSYLFSTLYINHEVNTIFYFFLDCSRICCVSMLCLIYFYTSEIYPTVIRTKGLGVNTALSRMGGIIAHLMIDGLSLEYFILILCLLNLFGLFFSFLLPETLKKPLKTHIEIEGTLDD
jgi:MFS family permease